MTTDTIASVRSNVGRTAAEERDDPAPAQVKHTLQLPRKLWSEFAARARRTGVAKSEALRRAIWLYIYVTDCREEGAEITVRRSDGTHERLVISPY